MNTYTIAHNHVTRASVGISVVEPSARVRECLAVVWALGAVVGGGLWQFDQEVSVGNEDGLVCDTQTTRWSPPGMRVEVIVAVPGHDHPINPR